MKIWVTSFAFAAALVISALPMPSRALTRPVYMSSQTQSVSIIRSASDLQRFLVLTSGRRSPLNALSPSARIRFVNSVTFNRRGVSGFRVDDIRAELTPTLAYGILSLFGFEKSTSLIGTLRETTQLDHEIMQSNHAVPNDFLPNYRCYSQGTCIYMPGYACTGTC